MPIYLLQDHGLDPNGAAIEATLKVRIPDLRYAASIEAISKSAGASGDATIAIVVLSGADQSRFNQLIELALRRNNEVFLILIGGEVSIREYKLLIRTGAVDWVANDDDLDEVLEIIARRRSRASVSAMAASSLSGRPVTISFIPSAGGV